MVADYDLHLCFFLFYPALTLRFPDVAVVPLGCITALEQITCRDLCSHRLEICWFEHNDQKNNVCLEHTFIGVFITCVRAINGIIYWQ